MAAPSSPITSPALPGLPDNSSASSTPGPTPSATSTQSRGQDFSTIFGNPTPSPTQTNNNNNNGGFGGSLATSASLYLYTFLATLVLLLSVSAAIVIRSFVLRRRHRLMVEEAIRNGTWVPPSQPSRGPRVDLSKKPELWESYLGGGNPLSSGSGQVSLRDGVSQSDIGMKWKDDYAIDWESIKPFTAAYVGAAPPSIINVSPNSVETTSSAAGNNVSSQLPTPGPIPLPTPVTTSYGLPLPNTASQVRASPAPLHRRLFHGLGRILNPTPDPTSPLPESSSDPHSGLSSSDVPMSELHKTAFTNNEADASLSSAQPARVRVAVMIAMPSPPSAHRHHHQLQAGAGASSISRLPSDSSHPLTASPSPLPGSASHNDDETPLPHLEVGVAEIVVAPRHRTEMTRKSMSTDSGSIVADDS